MTPAVAAPAAAALFLPDLVRRPFTRHLLIAIAEGVRTAHNVGAPPRVLLLGCLSLRATRRNAAMVMNADSGKLQRTDMYRRPHHVLIADDDPVFDDLFAGDSA